MNPEMSVIVLEFLVRFVVIAKELMSWALLGYIILRWIRPKPNPVFRFIVQLGHALCAPFAWARFGMISFSAIAALLAIEWGGNLLIRILLSVMAHIQGVA